jgi:hypothetical protein
VKIAFVTTCKNRAAHLAKTLPRNMAGNPHSTFIVLDYGSQEALAPILNPLRCERLKVYRHEARAFRMAHAKNMAHRLGLVEGADVVVNVDADNFIGDGFERFIHKKFHGHNATKYARIDQSVRPRGKFAHPSIFLYAASSETKAEMRGLSGRIGVTSNAFLETGGYNENFDTWSHDDRDFNSRLCYLGYRPVQIENRYLTAIQHSDNIRFRDYPHVLEEQVWKDKQVQPNIGVANFGRIGLGGVRRPDGSSVQLRPIPTRIFGIGLHKTATTSLHVAFQMLGLDSVHWPSGAWVRDVWNEMRINHRSPTLERSYALSDFPISLLYRELDRAYPGSKFILTIRDEANWIRSVRSHFSFEQNRHRQHWDAISHRIHQALYGRKDFDAKIFVSRYRRHNHEVREYFKHRPNDLLVMNMDRGAGWKELCAFLDRPIVTGLYPHEFVTEPKKIHLWKGDKI